MDEISMKLGQNLKKIRGQKGITQGDICRAINFDRGYVSSVENGKRNPTLSTMKKLADALKVPVDELLR
ncbi:helix-turn-helix transcriptional regulator [Candidatus Uhrbacteria bacterium]|nr:helix-turn-helix transcriptional regulator [Candidatus Uhrbacteria bacterium]